VRQQFYEVIGNTKANKGAMAKNCQVQAKLPLRVP